MKEIIYIQAGSLANYIGTHFWNTQECYFEYGSDEDGEAHKPLVLNEVSFRETLAYNEPILCPRLLVFDRKANFGTLSQRNALFGHGNQDAEDELEPSLWTGDMVEYKQDPIPKSQYHDRIEDQDHMEHHEGQGQDESRSQDDDLEVRYWSDYNRLYYSPQTVQKLPDIADWENPEGDWGEGRQLFRRFDEETALMEESLRSFAEECDLLQGIQLTHDIPTFGGFVDSFLVSFRDEFPKLSILAFPLLSDALSSSLDLDDHRGRRKALNDALCLRSLNEFVEMNVPIQSPLTWPGRLVHDRKSLYHTSALLSAHIESATIPLRLRERQQDFTDYASQLNWTGTTRFANLTGKVLDSPKVDFDSRIGFSMLKSMEDGVLVEDFARRNIFRGATKEHIETYDKWFAQHSPTHVLSSYDLPHYPLPTSFPKIFPNPSSRTVSTFTSVSTTPRMSSLFRAYGRFIGQNLSSGAAEGLNADEMKELANDLWVICDGYEDDSGGADIHNGELGEDEE